MNFALKVNKKINQFELSEIVMSRTEEILNEAKKEINLLTSKKIDYIIITGGIIDSYAFSYLTNLTSIHIPYTVRTIMDGIFWNTTSHIF